MANTVTSWKNYASDRTYTPFKEDVEKQWNGPFFFLQAADCQLGLIERYLEKLPNPKWDKEIILTRRAIEKANAMNPKPRFLVICGDLCDAYPDEQPEMRREQERDLKVELLKLDPEIPLVCLCGNHDVGDIPSKATVQMYKDSFGDDYYTFWCGGTFFIVINSQLYTELEKFRAATKHFSGIGAKLKRFTRSDVEELSGLAEEQDKWLCEQLKKIKSSGCKHAVVLQHIPWFVADSDEPDAYFNVPNPTRIRMMDRLIEAGVKVAFCGHWHRNGGGKYKDLEVVVTSAIGAQLGPDVSGLRVVRVLEDKIDHTYYRLDAIPELVCLES